jgi:hypothetical protein
MKSFYYRTHPAGTRILVGELERVDCYPTPNGYYELLLSSGKRYKVLSSIPDEVQYDIPEPETDDRYWFDRYTNE